MADPTADLRQQLADHEADKDKRDTKCFSNLGDCRGLSKEARRWNSRNQGSSQLTVWHVRIECKLTSRPRIQKQTKQEDTKIKTSGEGRKGTDQSKHSQHFRALLLRRCGCGLAYKRMWVWFRVHAHNTSNKNFSLKYFRCRDGKRTETRIGMEGICITHSCIPLYTVY